MSSSLGRTGLVRHELHEVREKMLVLARRAYYRLFFGHRIPWHDRFSRVVSEWEASRQKGDVPRDRESWDAQYANGTWGVLSEFEEISRYAVIVGYLNYLKPCSSLLDVGCGDGVLLERLRPYGYRKYVGLDLSAVAIAKLLPMQDPKTSFLQGDAETFQPSESFDAIIFNECLYYFNDPLGTLERYSKFLLPEGILIVSVFAPSARAMAILRLAKSRFKLLGETQTTQGAKSFVCAALQPRQEKPNYDRAVVS
jgi:SAM-dependent methyltransferase